MAAASRLSLALCVVVCAAGCGLSTEGIAPFDAAAVPADGATTARGDAASRDAPPDARDATTGPAADGGSGSLDGASETRDAAVTTDAADGGPAMNDSGGPLITCGSMPCAAPSVCCVTTNNNQASFACSGGTCTASGGGNAVALGCSGASSCPQPEVCCLTDQGNNQFAAACTAATTCLVDGGNQVQLCDPNAPDAGCPPGSPCGSSNVNDWGLPGGTTYGTCGDVSH